MKTIELNIDDVIHLMRGGTLELEHKGIQVELVVKREDQEAVSDMLPFDEGHPCPPFRPLFGDKT